MKTILLTLSITAVIAGSAACALAVPQAPRVHPDTPTWIADAPKPEPPSPPAPIAAAQPIAEVATEPISYTDLAMPVNNLPQPSAEIAPIQAPAPMQEAFQSVDQQVYASEDSSWYDKVEKYEVGNTYIADNIEQFDFHVPYRQVLPNGQLAAVPEPSSIVGLAAPVLGTLVYWRRRRSA